MDLDLLDDPLPRYSYQVLFSTMSLLILDKLSNYLLFSFIIGATFVSQILGPKFVTVIG
jgi:hypothetical protein